LDEFIPLFIFVFMIGTLYGTIAPLAGVFVAGFFRLTYKVFRYMTLFVYGNHYEGGGFLFYTVSDIIFYVLYMINIVIAGYLSVHGTSILAGFFSAILFITILVHRDVHKTFVEPSKTLALTKARAFDETRDPRGLRDRKHENYMRAKKEYEEATLKESEEKEDDDCEGGDMSKRLFKRLLPRTSSGDYSVVSSCPGTAVSDHKKRSSMQMADVDTLEDAVARFNQRYNEDELFDAFEDDENPNESNTAAQSNATFFIYRQPSLNRATWEVIPKSYRDDVEREQDDADLWGDERPEQTRKVARQRRASIAQYYGG
jgi:hypothetical protein